MSWEKSYPSCSRGRTAEPLLVALLLFLGRPGTVIVQGQLDSTPSSLPLKEIVYGGDDSFAPYEFLDKQGQPAGLNIDLIRAVAQEQGIQVRIRLQKWRDVRAGLQRGDLDVAAMYRSVQRAREVSFAIPHELIYHEMFIRRGNPALNSLSDLAGKRVLVQTDTFSADALAELGYQGQLVLTPSEPVALAWLAEGKGDVAIVTQTVGRPFAERLALAHLVTVSGPPILLTEYGFVTRKGRRDLVELLSQGVAEVKASGEYDRIYERWLRPDRSAKHLRLVAGGLGVALLAGLLFLIWNASLRRRVARQTQALRVEFEAKEQAQAALAESERNLRQSQKMEAVGRLAGGVAHDFNNLWTVVQGWAELLRDRLTGNGGTATEANEILAACERATRLTRQLLTFSRATPIEMTVVDLGAVLAGVKPMLQRLVGDHILVEVLLPSAPVVVDADLTLIEQILLNLAANARDAMPDGGVLKVAVQTLALAENDPSHLPAGKYALIQITDSGIGMDEATLSKAFEPFFTTKEIGRGTGLGLATVHANVTKLGGTVSVESTLGQGSRFRILLPLSQATTAAPTQTKRNITPTCLPTGETILLVDDDESLRRVVRLALEQAGFHVLEAKDGIEGEEVAGTGAFSILVTDVVMPRRNGPEMAANLRQQKPGLRVLFVSGYAHPNEDLDLDIPGTAFLAKPFSIPALLETIGQLAAQRQVARTYGPK